MIPSLNSPGPPDPSRFAIDAPPNMARIEQNDAPKGVADARNAPQNDSSLLLELRQAENSASAYSLTNLVPKWKRSYAAYRSEHHQNSKYRTADFKYRSSVFKPKTRSSVRKNMAAFASALFATPDVVKITASDEGDDLLVASAAIKQELLNYRLSRASNRNGIPWFLVAMGAAQDAQIAGIVVSEQTWRFKQRQTDETEWVAVVDEETGEEWEEQRPKSKILMDRPDIELHPPENVLIDATANWLNPAQSAGFVILRIPMQVDAIMAMINPGKEPGKNSIVRWRNVTREQILNANTTEKSEAQTTRQSREGGNTDRLDNANTGNASRYRPIWVYKAYMRIDDVDHVFWSVGSNLMLSDLMLVEEVYPEQGGDRPLVIGYGALEAHTPFPMAPVESWQPLQQEANDITNLRLDQMKQVVQPMKKVVRGRNIDLTQLNRAGAGTTLMVSKLEDMEWDRPPDVPGSAYQEANYINADFDDLAGAFGGASVATNRELNETVGGMRLLAGSAGSVTQFDIRIVVETWVEPVLRQIVKLEEMWETDEVVLAIAGEKAQLFQRFGLSDITDEFLMRETELRVDAGLGMGTPDPMEGVVKLGQAVDTAGKMLQPFIERNMIDFKPRENGKEIVNYVFSQAGVRDGGERFFEFGDPNAPPQQPPVDPRAAAEAAKTQAEAGKIAQQMQQAQQKWEIEAAGKRQQLAMGEEELKQRAMQTALTGEEIAHKRNLQALERTNKLSDLDMKRRQSAQQADDLAIRSAENRVGFDERRQAAAEAQGDRESERRNRAADRTDEQASRGADRQAASEDRAAERDRTAQDHRAKMGREQEAHDGAQRRADEEHQNRMKSGAEENAVKLEGQKAKVEKAKSNDDERDKAQDKQIKELTRTMKAMQKSIDQMAKALAKKDAA